jgi:hypothetical protein
VATPVPRRNVLTRRLFILGGFWSTLTLAFVGLVGPSLDFAWPRRVAGASRKVFVSADRVPAPGDDTVPWRADFTFRGRTGWFRCPCHGSTYTREGGVLVFGPAPRPLDRFEVEPQDDGSVVVTIGVKEAQEGSPDNPSEAVSYGA